MCGLRLHLFILALGQILAPESFPSQKECQPIYGSLNTVDHRGQGNSLVVRVGRAKCSQEPARILLFLFLLSSFTQTALTDSFVPSDIQSTPTETHIGALPRATITMMISGGIPGNRINATITVGFTPQSGEGIFGIGFRQEFLRIITGLGAVRARGLGYDEMRERPYFYTTGGEVFDHRDDPFPSWISRRHYAAWTQTASMALYLGPISEQNITEATYCGNLIEFENLTVYFEDNSSFVCGPRLISLAANFTRTGESWNTSITIETSDDEGVTIEEDTVTVMLRQPEPLSPILPTVGVVGLTVIVILFAYRRRTRESLG